MSLYVLVQRRSTQIIHACTQRGKYLYATCGASFTTDDPLNQIDTESVETARELRERATCKRCTL